MTGKSLIRIIVLTAAMAGVPAVAEEGHRHAFSRDVNAVHEILAPIWHSESGNERSRVACAQAPKLEQLTSDLRSADNTAMLKAIGVLKAKCQSSSMEIDKELATVHQAFHDLAKPGRH